MQPGALTHPCAPPSSSPTLGGKLRREVLLRPHRDTALDPAWLRPSRNAWAPRSPCRAAPRNSSPASHSRLPWRKGPGASASGAMGSGSTLGHNIHMDLLAGQAVGKMWR